MHSVAVPSFSVRCCGDEYVTILPCIYDEVMQVFAKQYFLASFMGSTTCVN